MASGAKIGRGLGSDVGSSIVWWSWGADADELLEPLEAEVLEDISNKDPKNLGEIRRNKRRRFAGDQTRGMRQKKNRGERAPRWQEEKRKFQD